MRVKIDGKHVMFQAIESMWYDSKDEDRFVVIRTMSGIEHNKLVKSEQEAEKIIEKIIDTMAICESI